MNHIRVFRILMIIIYISTIVESVPSLCGGGGAASTSIAATNDELRSVAAALGTLMIAIQGMKWAIAESPQERVEARKGIMYVIIGLLLVSQADQLVEDLYCSNCSAIGYC